MKNLSLTTLLILITLGFSSCAVEEDPVNLDQTSSLYEKITLQRDATGAYSWDVKLNDGADADVTDNMKNNGSDLYLFSSEGVTRNNISNSFELREKSEFKVGINNASNNTRSILTVKDKDIKFNRSVQDDHLSQFQMTDNGDNTYDLEFEVDKNIEVDFIQNQETGVYEIHLEPGNGEQDKFIRTFNKNDGEPLKIAFINYFYDGNSKSSNSETRKPEVWVEDD